LVKFQHCPATVLGTKFVKCHCLIRWEGAKSRQP